jgi:hypothetical protein
MTRGSLNVGTAGAALFPRALAGSSLPYSLEFFIVGNIG